MFLTNSTVTTMHWQRYHTECDTNAGIYTLNQTTNIETVADTETEIDTNMYTHTNTYCMKTRK